MLKKGFILTVLLIAMQCLFISTATALTIIDEGSAVIDSAVTWDEANSPYVITTDVTVNTEGSLTIEPGVVVKIIKEKGILVDGTLNAEGTADKRIVFTDSRDDAAGGDTNGDGEVTVPTAGYWAGIKITGTATLDYCDVRYAGNYYQANIYKTGTEPLTLSNSTLSYSLKDGLLISYSDGESTVNDCTFRDNSRYGVYIDNIETDSYTGTGNSFINNSKAPVCIAGGTLEHDITWGLEESPYYIIGDVTVGETAVLTVSPGVVVKFAKYKELHIEGTLTAEGNASDTINFTDYRDDAAGGDTNGDGAATSPTAGWWSGIDISDAGNVTMTNCVVRYAGYYNESGIYKTGNGLLTLADSTVSNSLYDGLRISYSEGASTINNCTVKDNNRYGIQIDDIETDSYTGTGNAFANNSKAPVCINGGTLEHNVTWNREGSPYYINGDVRVNDNAVLTVNPDVVVKFAQSKGLSVTGTLTANGTPTVGASTGTIYFTEYRDDAAGGDTNGDGSATTPAPGWWTGIYVNGSGKATLDNCVVRYGGHYYESNIYKTGTGELSLTNSELTNSKSIGLIINDNTGASTIAQNKIYSNKVGISCQDSNPVIGGSLANANRIYQNTDFGVENKSTDSVINAKYNWWGDATGPTHATNPSGIGDKVSDYVDFGNFLTLDNPGATLQSIEITTQANKLSYSTGENLDITGLVITGTYSDGSTKLEGITVANITGFNSATAKVDQVLTITVGARSTTYKVQIVGASISFTGVPFVQMSVNPNYSDSIGLFIGLDSIRDSNGNAIANPNVAGYQIEVVFDPTKVAIPNVVKEVDLGQFITNIDNSAGKVYIADAAVNGTSNYHKLFFLPIILTGSALDSTSLQVNYIKISDKSLNLIRVDDSAELVFHRGKIYNEGPEIQPNINDAVAGLQYLAGFKNVGTDVGEVNPINMASIAGPDASSTVIKPSVKDIIALMQYVVQLRNANFMISN